MEKQPLNESSSGNSSSGSGSSSISFVASRENALVFALVHLSGIVLVSINELTVMGDRLRAGKLCQYVTSYLAFLWSPYSIGQTIIFFAL